LTIQPSHQGYNSCGHGVYWVLADLGIHFAHPKHATSIMTQPKPLPPLELLLERFEYNEETGHLYYNNTPRNDLAPGTVAGYDTGRGWLRVKISGLHYKVHRIVWKMYYGEDPPEGLEVDHINRVRTDNRIENLRVVTRSVNMANSSKVLYAKGPPPKKTPEELAEIRKETAKKNSKPIVLICPDGEEKYYESSKEAAEKNNLNKGNISGVLTGRLQETKGYTARYAD